jgi:hypothetical protein
MSCAKRERANKERWDLHFQPDATCARRWFVLLDVTATISALKSDMEFSRDRPYGIPSLLPDAARPKLLKTKS